MFGEKMAFHMVCFILFIYLETAHSTAQAGLELSISGGSRPAQLGMCSFGTMLETKVLQAEFYLTCAE